LVDTLRPVPLPVLFENIPHDLKDKPHWVLWRYTLKINGSKPVKWDKPPYQIDGSFAKSTDPSTWATYETVRKAYEDGSSLPVNDRRHYDGIGFVPTGSGLLLIDLDKCVDENGEISDDARTDLDSLCSYTEKSPSGTGIRCIVKGSLPYSTNGRKKGRYEIYQGDHYLTVTGERLEEYSSTIKERQDAIDLFCRKRFDDPSRPSDSTGSMTGQMGSISDPTGSRSDDDVIRVAAAAKNGDKFRSLRSGDWECLGYSSQSEADAALCCVLAYYTQDEMQIDRILRGSGLYRDKLEREDYRATTICSALTTVTEKYKWGDQGSLGSLGIRRLDRDNDEEGAIGVIENGTVAQIVSTEGDGRTRKWISDCAICVDVETNARDVTEFTFRGIGARDKRPVCFTLPAATLSDSKKFKGALLNAFGVENKVGHLNFEMVQAMTTHTKHMRRVEVPVWDKNVPLLPGVGLAKDVEFRLSSYTPAEVHDGDLDEAKKCLRKLLRLHKYAPIAIAAILGAPLYARWFPNDRFGLALWGITGSFKTSFVQAVMTMYGSGYADDASLLKHGKLGATLVAAATIAGQSGFLPQTYDNVKTVRRKRSEDVRGLRTCNFGG
jgi:hypothetical protein